MKKKLSVSEQIKHMKMKGICFDIISEADAAEYLEHNNYYLTEKLLAEGFAIWSIIELLSLKDFLNYIRVSMRNIPRPLMDIIYIIQLIL